MDREISKEVRRKEQRKQIIKIGAGVWSIVLVVAVVISFLQTSLNRKDITISKVDKGVIEVSVSASGKVIPAFEEIINSPINSRIVEIYKKGGDSVDVGTPILKLDLQSAETEYNKLLDEEQMKRLELEKLKVTNQSKLSEMEMKLKVSRMELDRKAVELRNERYLDSLGAGTTDKVRQVELDFNVSQLKLKEDNHRRLRSGLKTDVYVMNAIKDDVLRIANASYYVGKGEYELFVINGDQLLKPTTRHRAQQTSRTVRFFDGRQVQ